MKSGANPFAETAIDHGTPALVLDTTRLRDNIARLRRALPGVALYYAVKANPAEHVLAEIATQNCRFDVASQREWQAVENNGGKLSDCFYSHPIKRPDELAAATAAGFKRYVADNISEIDKLGYTAPGTELVLRLRVSNPDCVVDLSEKFGCDPDQAEELLQYAIAKGLTPIGLAFHVGSQTTNPQPFIESLQRCRRIFDTMAVTGQALSLLDIGGGFPVDDGSGLIMDIETFCAPIRDALHSFFPNVEIIAEPGRFLIADAMVAVTRVIGKSERHGMWWYYLEDGIYGIFSGKVFDHQHLRFQALKKGAAQPSILAGPSCDSFDIIARDALLPDLDIGDILIAHNMGAYSAASASEFNGIPTTPIYTLRSAT